MNRKKLILVFFVATVALLVSACDSSATSTPVILADTFFTGCAFLDKNDNGLIDDKDIPIGGISFTVTMSDGTGFGEITSDSDGCATTIIPMGLPKESWPVLAQMTLPQTSAYIPIGDIKVTLDYPDTQVDFLFSQQ
jgi:hypothetical protein